MTKDLKQKGSGDNKKFAIRPFSAIKGIAVEKPGPEPKPVVTSVNKQQPGSQAEDDLLFLTEMAGVTRIHRHAKAQQPAARESAQGKPVAPVEPDESSLFLEALKELKLDVSFSDNVPEDDTPGPARKISRMRQLRRGSIRLNLEIDLHGLTRDEAIDALASFIPAACRRGQQAVLVIAGKGAHSPGEPVLQGAVSDWLATKGGEWVAEFALAPDTLGGEGAYVVFLKSGGRQ